MSVLPDPIPAATLVLMRPAGSAPPDLLMMERTASMAFAAGALVFPGGRIDPQDHAAAAQFGADFPDAAARIAAIRETIEETGIAPALLPAPDTPVAESLREGLAAGTPFAELLSRNGLVPDLDALTPFARWRPNFRESRSFDTLFFLAAAPASAPEPSAHEHEAAHAFWANAATVLAAHDAGRAHLIFPTRRNLERLALFASLDDAADHASQHPLRTITPWIEERGGRSFLCIPEDAGYPVTAEPLETAHRG